MPIHQTGLWPVPHQSRTDNYTLACQCCPLQINMLKRGERFILASVVNCNPDSTAKAAVVESCVDLHFRGIVNPLPHGGAGGESIKQTHIWDKLLWKETFQPQWQLCAMLSVECMQWLQNAWHRKDRKIYLKNKNRSRHAEACHASSMN